MDKVMIRLVAAMLAIGSLALMPGNARAQASAEPTQIVLGSAVPVQAGARVTIQAVLADSQGRPLSGEVIYFTAPAFFLGRKGNVVLAQALTNKNGQAVADFVDNFSSGITLQAEFRGDAGYAPSNAALELPAAPSAQVYVEHVGVDIPGFNVPPVAARRAGIESPTGSFGAFIERLWPAMNGWPVAAVLLLVWGAYLFAVSFVFRLTAMANESAPDPSSDVRRTS